MTAALYLLRLGRRVLLLESDSFGGQIASSPRVANYPGIPSIAGLDFADALLAQVTELGADIDVTRVTGLRKSSDGFEVICENGAFPCKTGHFGHRAFAIGHWACRKKTAILDAAFLSAQSATGLFTKARRPPLWEEEILRCRRRCTFQKFAPPSN